MEIMALDPNSIGVAVGIAAAGTVGGVLIQRAIDNSADKIRRARKAAFRDAAASRAEWNEVTRPIGTALTETWHLTTHLSRRSWSDAVERGPKYAQEARRLSRASQTILGDDLVRIVHEETSAAMELFEHVKRLHALGGEYGPADAYAMKYARLRESRNSVWRESLETVAERRESSR